MRLLARFWPSKLLIFLSLIGSSFAQPAAADDTWSADNFKFASKADGAGILGRSDEYVARLSRFDRSARLKTDKDISESDYLAFVSAQTLDWTDGEKSKVAEAAGSIVDALQKYNVPVTDVLLVRTTGKEEGNEAYTRGTAVFIPAKMMSYDRTKFRRLVAHELFHVISRTHPELRERLYAVIGYAKGAKSNSLPNSMREGSPIRTPRLTTNTSGSRSTAMPFAPRPFSTQATTATADRKAVSSSTIWCFATC